MKYILNCSLFIGLILSTFIIYVLWTGCYIYDSLSVLFGFILGIYVTIGILYQIFYENKYVLTYKEYRDLLIELVQLDKEFNLTVNKIENNEINMEIHELEFGIELIFKRQKEIYNLIDLKEGGNKK